ncbi:MAG: RNA polymerase sigma factor SigZ [Nitrospira sp.]|nr:RNA polymerase sigma factor SigZ [Nitrospira sp.]
MTTMTEGLWQGMHDGLRAFIAKRVSDQSHAEDVLQEVFVRVHRQLDSVNDPRRIISWIYQVTRNAIVDYYRKPGRRHEIPAGLSTDIEAFGGELQEESGDSGSELAGCLRPMIERLSQDYRDAINLVEFEGLTQQEAAKRMGISLSGMKSRVQRGRKQLKQMLGDCCLIELDRRGGVIEYQARNEECDPCAGTKRPKRTGRA